MKTFNLGDRVIVTNGSLKGGYYSRIIEFDNPISGIVVQRLDYESAFTARNALNVEKGGKIEIYLVAYDLRRIPLRTLPDYMELISEQE